MESHHLRNRSLVRLRAALSAVRIDPKPSVSLSTPPPRVRLLWQPDLPALTQVAGTDQSSRLVARLPKLGTLLAFKISTPAGRLTPTRTNLAGYRPALSWSHGLRMTCAGVEPAPFRSGGPPLTRISPSAFGPEPLGFGSGKCTVHSSASCGFLTRGCMAILLVVGVKETIFRFPLYQFSTVGPAGN